MLQLKELMREVPDFPKKGINFIDITPLLLNAEALRQVTNHFTGRYQGQEITKVIGIESRGFIFAPPVAVNLDAGFIPVRKPGKLPHKTVSVSYELEYGNDSVEMHEDAISQGDRVLIIDDLVATGGTARAAAEMVEKLGGTVVEMAFLVELTFLNPEKHLAPYKHFSLIKY